MYENKRSFYTHEDSGSISNGEECESDQECQLLMEFEYRSSNQFDDNFMDALEEKGVFIEEITHLKVCIEESKLAEETLKKQIIEKEDHNGKLECEISSLRKELEKEKILILDL